MKNCKDCSVKCFVRGTKIKDFCPGFKPKPTTVKIKAWAFYYRDRNGLLKLYANEHKATMPVKNIPCYIVINKKYLKGDKK